MARVDSGPSQLRARKFTYDFAVHGGAVSAITIGTLPDNAVLTNSYLNVYTAATSGGAATILLKVGATEVKAATRNNAVPYTAVAGAVLKKVLDTKTTAETAVTVTIGTAALTAGAFDLWVEYYQGA